MPISLYEASVPNYLQILEGVSGFLDKGRAYAKETGIDPESIVESSIFPDMRPFRYQIHSVATHSIGAVSAILTGFHRPLLIVRPQHDYAGLQAFITETRDALQKVIPEELNAREDADVIFEVNTTQRVFTAMGFLMSASLPNFYFHATTAYDILRGKGVPVGKRDYIGTLRLKQG